MVTKRYAHILDEDRKNLANEMEAKFYGGGKADGNRKKEKPQEAPSSEMKVLMELVAQNPELLTQFVQSVQLANKD